MLNRERERELAAALHLKYDQYKRALLSAESKAQRRLRTGIEVVRKSLESDNVKGDLNSRMEHLQLSQSNISSKFLLH